jgi:hypothetical protein
MAAESGDRAGLRAVLSLAARDRSSGRTAEGLGLARISRPAGEPARETGAPEPTDSQTITDFLKWKNRLSEYNGGATPEGLVTIADEANGYLNSGQYPAASIE